MRAVILGLLLVSVTGWGWVQDIHTFDGNIRDYVLGNSSVYVVTDKRLYQLSHDLTKVTVKDLFNASHSLKVNMLVPFIENNSLIICGKRLQCGYCELVDLGNITQSLYSEAIEVSSLDPNGSSIGFMVKVIKDRVKNETYILAGKTLYNSNTCFNSDHLVSLRNSDDLNQKGGIFSESDSDQTISQIKTRTGSIQFVDGFQIKSHIYLFMSLSSKVRLVWLESKTSKTSTFASLRGATLNCCDDRERRGLLSSSVIVGDSGGLWAGVFTANGKHDDPFNTALAIYNITPVTGPAGDDPDFCANKDCDTGATQDGTRQLNPVAVVFKYSSMTSVLAVRVNSWLVFFIGTGNGQLIKLAVDKAFKPACPSVLYRADDDRSVFPKMHLDPVDRKHVYIALRNQMRRVPVAQCGTHKTLTDCWAAKDPFCGWCESEDRCTFQDECHASLWLSIPKDSSLQRMVSYQVEKSSSGQEITLTVETHLSVSGSGTPTLACNFNRVLCDQTSPAPVFPRCSCRFPSDLLPAEGLEVTMRIRVGKGNWIEKLMLTNCSVVIGQPTAALCSQCITAGCSWTNQACSWAPRKVNTGPVQEDLCKSDSSGMNYSEPIISSITPSVLSFYGRNHALMTGQNLGHVTRVRIQGNMDCNPKESPVLNHTGTSLTFHIPSGDKGVARVCAVVPDGRCLGTASLTYRSSPSCTGLKPTSTWASGKRRIMVLGSQLEFVEGVVHGHAPQKIIANYSNGNLSYLTPPYDNIEKPVTTNVSVRVANQTLVCSSLLTYHPDPHFTSFTSTKAGNSLRVTIQKKSDLLNITKAEIRVVGVNGEEEYECELIGIETSSGTDSVTCDIRYKQPPIKSLRITFGNVTINLVNPKTLLSLLAILVVIPFIIIAVVLWFYRNKQRTLTEKMNEQLELLEADVRNQIRQGFVDLQTDKSEMIENVGAIPFLDYKHFASRIFFPDGGPVMTSCINDIGQDGVAVQPDESCRALARLIQNQLFLTSLVHAMEEQKTFTVKDKCAVASLLTVALHGDLPYLTQVMEVLLRALMDHPSNTTNTKLMLRRTESIVEKLLTNWMSICLYGFLRESVGQPLFLLVCALTQQMHKGPVDSVTEKALYTLNEDWLLWQAQEFSTMRLKVLFEVDTDGKVSEPLEVSALSCDTVQQVKEKILLAFKTKFGFPYNTPLRELHIQCETAGTFVSLMEVDATSEVLGGVTMLNTLSTLKVPDGASIKVLSRTPHRPLSPQGSLKDDHNFSTKYFHLIDPDVDQDHKKHPERKKLKLKEVYLNKLLSTKVAVHSFVENLFRTIWGTPNGVAPHAVKFFFDFLDTQAENKKIGDPEVLHIWKTNSLPLRYWVNILKNPQFVFDMEKTPHLDGCLSVIAQAFMDSFSLAETQLGKHAPTNKLLYAKDIPQYKQEVKAYYKQVRDQPQITSSEFKSFLLEESKKHENEFNESAALRELYRYMQRYFDEIKLKLDQNGAPAELKEQLQHVMGLFGGVGSCSWD